MIDAQTVRETAELIAPHVRRTPIVPAPHGGRFKLELLQPTGSFKVRGFFSAALRLDHARMRRGLLTVSAGNAALACAHVARTLGVPCRVVMFDTAPAVKLAGTRALGADVVLMTHERLHEWVHQRGWEHEPEVFIHPFADEAVMAGSATIALELIEDVPDLAAVFVPVGGGGLIAGIAAGLSSLRRKVRVIGVQSSGYALWPRALAAGGDVVLEPDTIADGTTAPFDASMFGRMRDCVAEWIVVPEAELRRTVPRLMLEAKLVAEGSGALSAAAMVGERATEQSVAVISGGNVDANRMVTLLTESVSP